jgi:hypothetical protein
MGRMRGVCRYGVQDLFIDFSVVDGFYQSIIGSGSFACGYGARISETVVLIPGSTFPGIIFGNKKKEENQDKKSCYRREERII